MKTRMIIRSAALLAALLILTACLAACGGSELKLTVNDMGTKTEVTAKTGDKTADVLKAAGIELGPKDETVPPADSELKDGTTEITVKRYAKVTVTKNGVGKTVELVGGTVEDALKAAGFTIEDGEAPDADPKAYLKDGMTIGFISEVKVQVTADGQTREALSKAADVSALLKELGITLGDDDEVSEKLDAKLSEGMKIIVKRVEYKEEKKVEKVGFKTIEKYDPSMVEGTSEVQDGFEGEKEVTYKVKYADGKEESREKLSEKITKEPSDEIITYGSREDADNGGAVPDDGGVYEVSRTPYYDCDGSGHGYYEIVYSDGTMEQVDF